MVGQSVPNPTIVTLVAVSVAQTTQESRQTATVSSSSSAWAADALTPLAESLISP